VTQIPCPVEHCDRPRRGDQQVCGACASELQRALAIVPELAQELETTLTRQTSSGTSGSGSETPLPYDPRATEAEAVLRSTLVGWVRLLMGEHPSPLPPRPARPMGPICAGCPHESCVTARETIGRIAHLAYLAGPADTLASMARWLLVEPHRLTGHAAAEEAVDEICAAVRAAWRAVDRAPDSTFAGPCPECGTGLYARPGATTTRCRNVECERSSRDADAVDIGEQHTAMAAQIEDQLLHSVAMSAVLANLGVHVPASTIRWWGSGDEETGRQRRLWDHGHDANRRPLYRVSEVLELHDERVKRASEKAAERVKREAKRAERIAG
jgi:hypothetical protein